MIRTFLQAAGMRPVGREQQEVARDERHAPLGGEEFAAAAQDERDLIEMVLVERGAGRRRRPAPGCGGFVLQRDAGGVRDGAFHIGSMDGHGLFPLLQWVPPRGFPYLYCISIRGGRKEGRKKQ